MVMLAYLTITYKVGKVEVVFMRTFSYLFEQNVLILCKDFMFILISLINEICPDLVSGGGV